ncbi:hypothetical protein [Saccharobesus litoralis]|nr:hypothetical protein [Saccharobesus litoralis]
MTKQGKIINGQAEPLRVFLIESGKIQQLTNLEKESQGKTNNEKDLPLP